MLSGSIDRIDEARIDGQRWLLVCDYKPRCERVRTPYLLGYPLQVFASLWALLEQAPDGTQPAGVLIIPLWPDTQVLKKNAFQNAQNEQDRRLLLYRPSGLFAHSIAAALDPVLKDKGAHSRMYPMRRTKDGPFYSNDPVVEPDELRAYAALAEATIRQAAETLLAGEVTVRPLVERRTLACQRCPLWTVCRFEHDLRLARKAETHLPLLENVQNDAAGQTARGAAVQETPDE